MEFPLNAANTKFEPVASDCGPALGLKALDAWRVDVPDAFSVSMLAAAIIWSGLIVEDTQVSLYSV